MVTRILLFLGIGSLITMTSCTIATTKKGDFLATSAKYGVVENSSFNHTGGINTLVGSTGSQRHHTQTESSRPGFINVGGPNGITMSGTITHPDAVRELGQVGARLLRIEAAKEISKDLINSSVEVINK